MPRPTLFCEKWPKVGSLPSRTAQDVHAWTNPIWRTNHFYHHAIIIFFPDRLLFRQFNDQIFQTRNLKLGPGIDQSEKLLQVYKFLRNFQEIAAKTLCSKAKPCGATKLVIFENTFCLQMHCINWICPRSLVWLKGHHQGSIIFEQRFIFSQQGGTVFCFFVCVHIEYYVYF
jgi:hypothetical protein